MYETVEGQSSNQVIHYDNLFASKHIRVLKRFTEDEISMHLLLGKKIKSMHIKGHKKVHGYA